MNPYPLILASTSRYRGALLGQLGLAFEAKPPEVDEDIYKNQNLVPEQLALKLSVLKAQAVFDQNPTACVIGSDQVCSLGEIRLSKPGTKEKAIAQILQMQNRSHQLITAVTVISPKGTHSFTNKTTLHMRPLSQDQAISYIEADLPLDCAGSYKLESKGIKLFTKIEMDDHTSIIGLPLIQLNNYLMSLGYPL